MYCFSHWFLFLINSTELLPFGRVLCPSMGVMRQVLNVLKWSLTQHLPQAVKYRTQKNWWLSVTEWTLEIYLSLHIIKKSIRWMHRDQRYLVRKTNKRDATLPTRPSSFLFFLALAIWEKPLRKGCNKGHPQLPELPFCIFSEARCCVIQYTSCGKVHHWATVIFYK